MTEAEILRLGLAKSFEMIELLLTILEDFEPEQVAALRQHMDTADLRRGFGLVEEGAVLQ